MTLPEIEVCCPVCHGDLHGQGEGEGSLSCTECRREFPVLLGIPDLRVFSDPYIDIEADREKARRVASRFGDLDFAGLVDFYYSITPAVPRHHALQYRQGLVGGSARAAAALATWERFGGLGPDSGTQAFLDLGCGTAPMIAAASSRFARRAGVDIAFRWLVVGKKRLAEAGAADVPLICACAEALPFRDGTFDRVAGESVIECVRDQGQALAEAFRVIRVGGKAFFSTPNKFSLGPDPHTGIPAGGFLPAPLVASYVRRQGGVPPQRRLLSASGVRRLLVRSGFTHPVVTLPDIPAGQQEHLSPLLRRAVGVYHGLKRLAVGRWFLRLFGPVLYVMTERQASR